MVVISREKKGKEKRKKRKRKEIGKIKKYGSTKSNIAYQRI